MKLLKRVSNFISGCKTSLSYILLLIKKAIMFMINKIAGVDELKVVFISFNGKSYSDNPRAISEKLHELYLYYKIVWLFNQPNLKKNNVPEYIRCVKVTSIAALKELATAKVWVNNFPFSPYVYKSDKQIYIQTWHGDKGPKKILLDARTGLNKEQWKKRLLESKICNLMLSGSEFGNKVYRTAFDYSGDIYTFGLPRNDQLIIRDSDKAKRIKRALNVDETTKIMLYAPTFRDSKRRELHKLDDINLVEVIERLQYRTSSSWVCFIRAHSAVPGFDFSCKSDPYIIDVTEYEDMNELLLISDLLITDYSSSAGDFALLDRPVILFQPDLHEYQKHDREFYFDIESTPFLRATNQKELVDLIDQMDWDKIPQNCKEIREFYQTIETGEAAKRAVEYIVNRTNHLSA